MSALALSPAVRHSLRVPTLTRSLAYSPRSTATAQLARHAVRQRTPALAMVVAQQQRSRMRVHEFHESASRRAFIPAPPQKIIGTVNDPSPVPEPSATHGSYHWTFERILAAGLVPLTVAPFIGGALNPLADAVFCGALLLHSHVGFQAVIIDYIPLRSHPGLHKTFQWLLRLGTVVVGVGLYEFETNDIGLTGAVAKIWKA